MATGARGEATIETKERAYPLLFTNRALAEVEKALGKTIVEIGQNAVDGRMGLGDTAEMLRIGLEYGRREDKWSKEVVRSPLAYEIMDELGFQPVALIVLECLLAVMSYDSSEPAKDDDNPPA